MDENLKTQTGNVILWLIKMVFYCEMKGKLQMLSYWAWLQTGMFKHIFCPMQLVIFIQYLQQYYVQVFSSC